MHYGQVVLLEPVVGRVACLTPGFLPSPACKGGIMEGGLAEGIRDLFSQLAFTFKSLVCVRFY